MTSLNSDLGESLGLHSFGNDERLLRIIDVANVACGFHAGDPETLRTTVEAAVQAGVAVGAHPGLPDLVGFGRRAMQLSAAEVGSLVLYQVGALVAFLARSGGRLSHIKPHGALYDMVGRDPELMHAVADVAELYEVPLYGLAGTAHEAVAAERGIPFVAELYVDLDYNADGTLRIERKPRLTDPAAAAERVREALAGGSIAAWDGTRIAVSFDSVCVHSDTANSVDVAAAVAAVIGGASTAKEHP